MGRHAGMQTNRHATEWILRKEVEREEEVAQRLTDDVALEKRAPQTIFHIFENVRNERK